MKQLVFFMVCLFAGSSFSFAQQAQDVQLMETKPVIKVSEDMHDFGKIKEEDGNATCEFVITNTGNAPLVLNRVSASCGCTTPDWTKEPIAPGKTGVVKVTYGAKGRPGPFVKTISVFSNAQEAPFVLKIKGDVVPMAQNPTSAYPSTIGDLRLKQTALNFNAVKITEIRKQVIEVYNPTSAPVELSFSNVSKGISVTANPVTLAPQSAGKIEIAFDGSASKGSYGKQNKTFNVLLNKKSVANNSVSVSAIVIDDFSFTSPKQIENAPIITYSPGYINFGSLADAKPQVLKISNSGKSDLVIRSIQAENENFIISGGKKTIKAGESADFNVEVSKKNTAGANTALYIVTNDPKSPMKTIRLVVKK